MEALLMTAQTKNAMRSVFLTLCMMGLFAILSSTMSKNFLKPFSESLATPTVYSGFVGSASTIPGILISLPAASLSDILGRKRFLLIAGFIFASAPFLYLLITVWWQLIIIRFYHGFATAIFVPVAEASIAEVFPSKKGERISLFTSATYVGRLSAPVLGGYILSATATNYNVLYSAAAVAGVTALIMALPFLVERKHPALSQKGNTEETVKKLFSGWRTVARNRGALMVCFIQASQYYAYGVIDFFLAGYLKDVAHLDPVFIGIIIASIIGVAVFARPYMGRVSDKIGRRTPIAAGSIISGLPLLAIPFVTNFWVLLLLVAVYGFGFATVTASTPALICELTPKDVTGTCMGFLDMIMDVGQTLGQIISGLILATYLQYRGVFPLLTVVLLCSCMIFIASGVARTKSNVNE
jgi:MFS family permease